MHSLGRGVLGVGHDEADGVGTGRRLGRPLAHGAGHHHLLSRAHLVKALHAVDAEFRRVHRGDLHARVANLLGEGARHLGLKAAVSVRAGHALGGLHLHLGALQHHHVALKVGLLAVAVRREDAELHHVAKRAQGEGAVGHHLGDGDGDGDGGPPVVGAAEHHLGLLAVHRGQTLGGVHSQQVRRHRHLHAAHLSSLRRSGHLHVDAHGVAQQNRVGHAGHTQLERSG
mmetsp:Transcript_10053/g.18930  ORF Transcript_10053/g.18930 Transcript_10053/m.18930 type:complete len:228 (+) Transcript_10053:360-1043(+)